MEGLNINLNRSTNSEHLKWHNKIVDIFIFTEDETFGIAPIIEKDKNEKL